MLYNIANNLLASRLGLHREDESDTEDEQQRSIDEELPSKLKVLNVHVHGPTAVRLASIGNREPSVSIQRSRQNSLSYARLAFKHNRAQYNIARTLEKMKPRKGDFRSILFSKFVENDRLNRIVEDAAIQQSLMATIGCQTDEHPEPLSKSLKRDMSKSSSISKCYTATNDNDSLLSAAYCDISFDKLSENMLVSRQHSNMSKSSSISKCYTATNDNDSLLSAAYCDISFDKLSENMLVSRQHSSFSVLQRSSPCLGVVLLVLLIESVGGLLLLEDEEPLLPSRTNPVIRMCNNTSSKPLTNIRIPRLSSIHEVHPTAQNNATISRHISCSNLSDKAKDCSTLDYPYERTRSMFDLLVSDYDTQSISSRSTMVDSGYDKSHHEELYKPAPPQQSTSLFLKEIVDEKTERNALVP
ncbi:hypothetical protein DICVIV_08051 [Dictyocaulus viviparus]|uniref:Uncharacterized protein n=1 Tax=Dictyocaulus viviparus TaxID=29172 RepID=A0A0D8XU43_DICVI|nr:hypothetical protein DICVIV_08051 [Dictyocaulus viviparus]